MSVHEESNNQMKTMRKNLKNLRKEKGWSVEELSKKSEISVEILRLIENEKDFDLDHLFRLCNLYRIEVDKIFLPIKK